MKCLFPFYCEYLGTKNKIWLNNAVNDALKEGLGGIPGQTIRRGSDRGSTTTGSVVGRAAPMIGPFLTGHPSREAITVRVI